MARTKPSKPYDGFPLYPHASGHWAKKIRGKTHYFGRWDDWQTGLDAFNRDRDALYAGHEPSHYHRGLVVGHALDLFLSAKKRLVDSGGLTEATYGDYYNTCRIVADSFGQARSVESLGASDFDALRGTLAARYGPVRLKREVIQVRMIFRYCYENGHIDHPVRMGTHFTGPKQRELRLNRARNGQRFFEAVEIHMLLAEARPQVKAMILLGVNCGFGNHDCGQLEFAHLDLDDGWHRMPRPKTGIGRRAKLWVETMEAIRNAIEVRPVHNKHEELVFLTKYRKPWYKNAHDSPLSNEFRKLLDRTGLYRRGRTFYALRHTFETVAGESRDQVAVDHVMGHIRDDMASVYREKISDERLEAVATHVHKWFLQGEQAYTGRTKKNSTTTEAT